MNRKFEFLYQSINDTQSTIRAIDVKIGFLFVIAFMPLTLLKDITPIGIYLWNNNIIYILLILIITSSWAVSTIYLFLALTSISDPCLNISGNKPNGFFYGKNIFTIKKKNLINTSLSNNFSVQELSSSLLSDEEIFDELIFEKMKTTYIREIKLHRYFISTTLMYIWLFSSIIIYFGVTIINSIGNQ